MLFADADGATKFSDLRLLDREMSDLLTKTSSAVVVGSRAHLAEEAVAQVLIPIVICFTYNCFVILLHSTNAPVHSGHLPFARHIGSESWISGTFQITE